MIIWGSPPQPPAWQYTVYGLLNGILLTLAFIFVSWLADGLIALLLLLIWAAFWWKI